MLDLYSGIVRSLEGACFPELLKELSLQGNPIHSLKGVNFPDLLVLDLTGCPLGTLKDVNLPSLLEVLNLDGTNVTDLEDVMLPNLKVFTYDGNVIPYISRLTLPPTLEALDFSNQNVRDWHKVKFPIGLKVLKLVTRDPTILKFPPSLETLEITYPKNSRARYWELRLPTTLSLLRLVHGVSKIFDWNLPNLLKLSVLHFRGPISIPGLVEILHLEAKDKNVFEQLDIPGRVEEAAISYPARSYPISMKLLMMPDHDSTMSLRTPRRLWTLPIP